MPRPIQVTVHPEALRANLARLRADTPDARVWGVVKANAYGHGIERALEGLRGVDGFALLDLDEASRLRALDWRGPLLLLEGCKWWSAASSASVRLRLRDTPQACAVAGLCAARQ
jgi:alanine racemase